MLLNWITPVTGLELSSCDIYLRQSKGNEIAAERRRRGGRRGGSADLFCLWYLQTGTIPLDFRASSKETLTLNHECIVMSLINQLLVGREVSLHLQSL